MGKKPKKKLSAFIIDLPQFERDYQTSCNCSWMKLTPALFIQSKHMDQLSLKPCTFWSMHAWSRNIWAMHVIPKCHTLHATLIMKIHWAHTWPSMKTLIAGWTSMAWRSRCVYPIQWIVIFGPTWLVGNNTFAPDLFQLLEWKHPGVMERLRLFFCEQ